MLAGGGWAWGNGEHDQHPSARCTGVDRCGPRPAVRHHRRLRLHLFFRTRLAEADRESLPAGYGRGADRRLLRRGDRRSGSDGEEAPLCGVLFFLGEKKFVYPGALYIIWQPAVAFSIGLGMTASD